MGTHLKVLSESFPMNTNITGFRCFFAKNLCIPVLRMIVALALEWLSKLTSSFSRYFSLPAWPRFSAVPLWVPIRHLRPHLPVPWLLSRIAAPASGRVVPLWRHRCHCLHIPGNNRIRIIIYNIQIWHPCVVYNRNNSPERGVSPEGVHSSLGGVIPVVHHTGMSYLFYYTEQHTKHKRGKIDKHQRFWINTLLLKIYKLQ